MPRPRVDGPPPWRFRVDLCCGIPMDQFSFHGPFAYRWIDDVPVERIDLRSGERRSIEVGSRGVPQVFPEDAPANPCPFAASGLPPHDVTNESSMRAAMAAWN